MLEELKYKLWTAAAEFFEKGGISLSCVDREQSMMVITPEQTDEFRPEQMVVVDFNGNIIEGEEPASDFCTHLELYKAFTLCGSVARSISPYAVAFAQSGKPIPPFGSFHASHFCGEIPATRLMTKQEIETDYEKNAGILIADTFKSHDYRTVCAVLLSGNCPYCWGADISDAVNHAQLLEQTAQLALHSLSLTPGLAPISQTLLNKFYVPNKMNK